MISVEKRMTTLGIAAFAIALVSVFAVPHSSQIAAAAMPPVLRDSNRFDFAQDYASTSDALAAFNRLSDVDKKEALGAIRVPYSNADLRILAHMAHAPFPSTMSYESINMLATHPSPDRDRAVLQEATGLWNDWDVQHLALSLKHVRTPEALTWLRSHAKSGSEDVRIAVLTVLVKERGQIGYVVETSKNAPPAISQWVESKLGRPTGPASPAIETPSTQSVPAPTAPKGGRLLPVTAES